MVWPCPSERPSGKNHSRRMPAQLRGPAFHRGFPGTAIQVPLDCEGTRSVLRIRGTEIDSSPRGWPGFYSNNSANGTTTSGACVFNNPSRTFSGYSGVVMGTINVERPWPEDQPEGQTSLAGR